MADQQTIDLKAKGIYSHGNPLSKEAVPPGAFIEALNTVIDKDDVIEGRRGTKKYGATWSGSAASKLFGYKDRVLKHYDTTKLAYDSDGAGTWADYSGSYTAPSGVKMRSFESNQNFYFSTNQGVKKLDSLTATPTDSGMVKALDGNGAVTGASGFLANNNQVAYRVVWGKRDANDNLILGSPSQRIIVANTSGGSRDISLTFTIPDGVTTSYIYQIYRSGPSGGATTDPSDELQLVYENSPTSAEITAKLITVTDSVVEALRGASLYTNATQQGIAEANDPPPLCKDMDVFKNHALYANTQTRFRKFLNLIAVGNNNLNFFDRTGDISIGTNTILNVSGTVAPAIAIGQLVTGTGIPANTTVTNVSGTTVTMSANATATTVGLAIRFRDTLTIDGDSFYANNTEDLANKYFAVGASGVPADDIESTAYSLIKIVNRQSAGVDVYGYYLSGFDDLPGQMLFEDKALGGTVWYLTSSKGASFSPVLPNSGTTVASSNETKKNRLYVAKPLQPEAVPLLSYFDVGSADKDIYRVIALRDSAFIFKGDGIFRMTGDSRTTFAVAIFDNTAVLKGIETAVKLNNQIFCYTTQGASSVSDNGVQVLSRAIEKDLLKIFSAQYTTAESVAFGIGYETERKYILWTVKSVNDTRAQQAWVYNLFTNAWTRWEKDATCGFINSADDKMYLGQGDANYVRQERKAFDLTDYAEDEYDVTITGSDSVNLTVDLVSTASVVVGQTIAQISGSLVVRQAKVESIVSGTRITVDRAQLWSAAAAKLYDPIPIDIQWSPVTAGNPGVLKQFPEMKIFFREARFQSIDLIFSSDIATESEPSPIEPISTGNWGEEVWGEFPWGGGPPDVQPIQTYVPLEYQMAHWLNIDIEHTEALTQVALAGISIPFSVLGTAQK